tara:strand:- start:2946 stop:3311 length:366 start_codon:yes stop_codon:yes gene_type:complete
MNDVKFNNGPIKGTVISKSSSKLKDFAEKVYFDLNRIYSSPYCSTDTERESAIFVLANYLKDSKDMDDLNSKLKDLNKKMEDLTAKADMKQKICTIIKDRYWERTFIPSVKSTLFDIKQNL